MAMIGYARVSTEEQTSAQQIDALRKAGCDTIFADTASGAQRSRPELARALDAVGPGDVLVCARIDRLARSLVHLLEIVEGLDTRGIGFRSLADPIDTTSPQGRLTLQILGAVAEFERALIRERTRAGLERARREGRRGGNPELKARGGQQKLARVRDKARTARLIEQAGDLIPLLARMRPDTPWDKVAQTANTRGLTRPDGRPWTRDSLIRASQRFVREGFLERTVLSRSRRGAESPVLVEMVAAIWSTLPEPTLAATARALERQYIRTPRGGTRWSVSSVDNLLKRARKAGLITGEDDFPAGKS